MACPEGQYFCNDRGKCMPIPKGHKVRKDGELVKEVAPPGWGHTKAEKEKTDPSKPKSKIGGSAAAFDRARKEGRFKGSKEDMFKLMWYMKNKGGKPKGKPHYKPGTDEKYKKYQDDDVKEGVLGAIAGGVLGSGIAGPAGAVAGAALGSKVDIIGDGKKKKKKKPLNLADPYGNVAKAKKNESFEIDPKAHKKARKDAKIGNLARKTENPGEKAAAERKQKGPKLFGEVTKMTTVPQKDRKKIKDRYQNLHKPDPDGTIPEELTYEGFLQKAADAMKKVARKKEAPKHEYPGRDAGDEYRKKLRKKDHETVNFLDPDD